MIVLQGGKPYAHLYPASSWSARKTRCIGSVRARWAGSTENLWTKLKIEIEIHDLFPTIASMKKAA